MNITPPSDAWWTNLAFICKTETLDSLYSHALLIPIKSFKSKNQDVQEHKFKDLLSSTCLSSWERRLLNLESEVIRGPGSIPTGGNLLSLDVLYSHSKAENANIGIFVKNSIDSTRDTRWDLVQFPSKGENRDWSLLVLV